MAGVAVGHQIALAASGNDIIVTRTILACDHALVRNALEERPRQHQVLQILHLSRPGFLDGFVPIVPHAESSPPGPRLVHLLHGVAAIRVPERARKDRPVGISPDIVVRPIRLFGIVESLGNVFIRRLAIQSRFGRRFRQILADVPPIVLAFRAGIRVLIVSPGSDNPPNVMIFSNLIRFPLIFVSGIFVPLSQMQGAGLALAYLSPLTYLVDLVNAAMSGTSAFTPLLDCGVLTGLLDFAEVEQIGHATLQLECVGCVSVDLYCELNESHENRQFHSH